MLSSSKVAKIYVVPVVVFSISILLWWSTHTLAYSSWNANIMEQLTSPIKNRKKNNSLLSEIISTDTGSVSSSSRSAGYAWQNLNKTEVLSNKSIIIVLAYMRTGSTLTASLLQEYSETFYVFEPIRYVTGSFNSKSTTTHIYLNGTNRHYDKEMRHEIIMNEVRSWLTCKIYNLSIGSLTDKFHSHYTKYMKKFGMCYRHANGSMDSKTKCLKQAVADCENAPLIVLKFIRLRMNDILSLLPYFPNMKIIHLVRDPRGIMNSRRVLKGTPTRLNVQNHCNSIWQDVNNTRNTQTNNPGRVRIVYYEDMAERPVDTSKYISDFSGIPFTAHMKRYIISQTSATRNAGNFSTVRTNSTKTASKWRTMLDANYAQFVYNACVNSNLYLGYLPFQTGTDQRNMSLPSRRRP